MCASRKTSCDGLANKKLLLHISPYSSQKQALHWNGMWAHRLLLDLSKCVKEAGPNIRLGTVWQGPNISLDLGIGQY